MSDKKNSSSNNAGSNDACSCSCNSGCGCPSDCDCGCQDGGDKCCRFCPGSKTLAFWVLRVWLGFRALFTGLSKWSEKSTGDARVSEKVGAFLQENYGTVAANSAAQTGDATTLATAIASKATQAAQFSDPAAAANAFTGAYNAALPKVTDAIAPATDAAAQSVAAAKKAFDAAVAANDPAAASAALAKVEVTTSYVHHGLPQGGDWTFEAFKTAKIWYMPEWALTIFENTLGYVLVALGVTLLLGIGTRVSLFVQGLLYCGLTLGFIAISKEPGSSAGITMLGVHVALIVAALVLVKHNKLAVLKKF